MSVDVGAFTTDDVTTEVLYDAVAAAKELILNLEDVAKQLCEEIDARIDIVEYMSLAGKAAKQGKLVTDEWLWNDLEVEEEAA